MVIDKTAKWLIENYTGLEYKALMKDFLSGMRSNDAAKALTTILEKPEDPAANLTLGLHYALKLKNRKLGWNLLVKGESSDADIAVIGKMELSKPKEAISKTTC